MSLRWRLTLWYLGLTALVLLAFGGLSYWILSNSLRREIDRTLVERANHVSDALAVVPNRPIAGLTPEATDEFRSPGIYVQILDAAGNVVARSFNLGSQQLPQVGTERGALALNEVYRSVQVNGQPVRLYYRPIQRDGVIIGAVEVGQSLVALQDTLRYLRLIYAGGAVFVAFAGIGGSLWVARRGLQPVVGVTRTAREIVQAEDLSRRVEYAGSRDEIGTLAATFNKMLDRLQAIFESQQQFLAEAAHELRTPLASMLGNVDLLLRHAHDSERQQEAAAAIQRTGRHVARLLDDLLLLAQAEAGWRLQREPLAADDVFLQVYEAMLAVSGGVRLTLERCEPAEIEADPDRLRQVFTNLIDNALQYSESGSEVSLSLWAEDDRVWVRIVDSGCGIEPEALSQIYDPFFSQPANVRRSGTGLGLTIVHWIVHEHRGTIDIQSDRGQGTNVLLSFPAYSS